MVYNHCWLYIFFVWLTCFTVCFTGQWPQLRKVNTLSKCYQSTYCGSAFILTVIPNVKLNCYVLLRKAGHIIFISFINELVYLVPKKQYNRHIFALQFGPTAGLKKSTVIFLHLATRGAVRLNTFSQVSAALRFHQSEFLISCRGAIKAVISAGKMFSPPLDL